MKSEQASPYRIETLATWIDERIAPKSVIGIRLHVPRHFQSGQEEDARSSALHINAAALLWKFSFKTIAAILASSIDPAEAFLKLLAGGGDSADAQRVLIFLDAIRELWNAQRALGHEQHGLPVLAQAEFEHLMSLQAMLAVGRTRGGFSMTLLAPKVFQTAEKIYTEAQSRFENARAAAFTELASRGVEFPASGSLVLPREQFTVIAKTDAVSLLHIVHEVADTVVCEPSMTHAMITAQRDINAALLELQNAQAASLQSIARQIQQHSHRLEAALQWIAEFDAQWQRIVFAATYESCIADTNVDVCCEFVDAALLPLAERLGSGYTPISYTAAPLAIITGSNMGGKTAALATAAFLALLVQRGLPVPAAHARISLYDQVQGLQGSEIAREGLSDFGEEMMRLQQIVTAPPARRLVIIDEFARTTNVNEGRALLIAVIRYLRSRGDTIAVATHIDGVAAALGVSQYRIAGLREPIDTSDTDSLSTMLFRISRAFDRHLLEETPDAVLPADALTIAAAFGLPAEIVEDARKGCSNQ